MLTENKTTKTYQGAQGVKTLCLSSLALVIFASAFVSASALAQPDDLINRLNRVENEVQTLNRAVYKGERPDKAVYNAADNGVSSDVAAQMEIRLQQLETQIRELTGKIEQQTYDINQLKLQAEQAASAPPPLDVPPQPLAQPVTQGNDPLDLGFRPPEPQGMKTAVPGGEHAGDATAQYEQAYANLRAENYDLAQQGFESFLSGHSDHVLAANAKYWLGETFYVRGDYKTAARTFAEGFQKYPESAKSPDILLKLGMSLAGMGKTKDACVALSQLPVKFPSGNEPVLQRGTQEMDKLGCGA